VFVQERLDHLGSTALDPGQQTEFVALIRIRAQLAFLSPRIQAAILNGSQPPDLSLERIVRTGAPLDWSEQERVFGFSA
jgi:hypothetical protein